MLIQTHDIGEKQLTISARVTPAEVNNLISATGRIFMISAVDFDGDETATIRLVPSNGTVVVQRSPKPTTNHTGETRNDGLSRNSKSVEQPQHKLQNRNALD